MTPMIEFPWVLLGPRPAELSDTKLLIDALAAPLGTVCWAWEAGRPHLSKEAGNQEEEQLISMMWMMFSFID